MNFEEGEDENEVETPSKLPSELPSEVPTPKPIYNNSNNSVDCQQQQQFISQSISDDTLVSHATLLPFASFLNVSIYFDKKFGHD